MCASGYVFAFYGDTIIMGSIIICNYLNNAA